jgi:hypothetical protein
VVGQSRRFLEPPILPRWAHFHKGFCIRRVAAFSPAAYSPTVGSSFKRGFAFQSRGFRPENRGVFSSRQFSHGHSLYGRPVPVRGIAVEEPRESRGRWSNPVGPPRDPAPVETRCDIGISDTADSPMGGAFLQKLRSVRSVRRHVALILRGHTHADSYGAECF